MSQMKRMLVVLLLAVFTVAFVACNESTTTTSGNPTTQPTTVNPDSEAPVITLTNETITHQTGVEVSLLAGVSATDNVSSSANITIIIDNYGGYDRSVAGTYTLTIKATDEAGNFSTKSLTVIVKDDVLAPMLTGTVSPITHLAGETVDLTKGLTAVDNVDGVNVTFSVSSYGNYVNGNAGTYTIQITMTDSSGNTSAPFNRQIIVEEAYARAEMTSFAGDVIRQPALYNPQVLNGNTGTNYNSAYDGHFVNVLSKDYLEWLIQYAPDRLGSGVGWSVIAVTDADNKIVYVRHWNSGEAYLDNEGALKSVLAEDWSTGSPRSWSAQVGENTVPMSNAKYSSGEMGLMLANILKWVPEDGHIFMFMNWTTIGLNDQNVLVSLANTATMPRSMGANFIMNSDEDGDDVKDYALGRTLEIKNPELSRTDVRDSFDPENPFPVISIPYERYVGDAGIWKNRYEKKVYLYQYSEANPYNPLEGIVANDGKGNDISDEVTYKIYLYKTPKEVYGLDGSSLPITHPLWEEYVETPWVLADNEVTLEEALSPTNNNIYYVVEYTVSANGNTDKAYQLIKIQASTPDYLELYGPTDTAFSKVMGFEQRLAMNPNLVEFGALNETDRGMIFTGAQFNALATLPVINKGVVVVLDNFYQAQLIRFSNGLAFEMDKHGVIKSTDLTWTSDDLLDGLKAVTPLFGYVIVYPEGLNATVMNNAFKAYYDFNYDGSVISEINQKNGRVEIQLPIKEVQEVSSLVVNDQTISVMITGVQSNIQVVSNNLQALVFNSALGGAGFRQGSGKAYYYTKSMYQTLSQDASVVSSFTTLSANKGTPWFRDGVIVVLDANGDFVLARIMTTSAAAEIYADGTVVFGNAAVGAASEAAKAAAGTPNLTWDLVVPNAANTVPHGPLMDILNVVPDGGSFMMFPGTTTGEVRNYGVSLVWNKTYPGSGAIVDVNADPVPATASTHGFDATTFNSDYFTNLKIEVKNLQTIVAQSPKITRPAATIVENTLTWTKDVKASSYDLYYNGLLMKKAVGVLGEDLLTYTLDLSTIPAVEGTYNIQLRAITADPKVAATSVLGDPISFIVDRLDEATNFVRTDNILSWNPVSGASKYLVSINGKDYVEVTEASIVLPDEDIINGVIVKVIASGSETLFDSMVVDYTLVVEVIPMEIALGSYVLPVKEFIVSSWMRYAAGDIGAANIEGIIVINNAVDFLTLDDSVKVFSGGYAVVIDQNMAIKYIVDRWGHEWNATNGWTTNAEGWNFGANFFVSHFRPYLAEGDKLIIASQYSKGLTEGTWRNYLGNVVIKDMGSVVLTNLTDHRTVTDLTTAVDPTTVVIDIREKVLTKTISLGSNDLPLVTFNLESWLKLISVTGSNDIGAASVEGIIMIEGAYGISAWDDSATVFSGGYAILLDKDMKIKYVVDRWAHEWNDTNGWTTNPGGWTWALNLKASYFKPYLAEGDILILASQYAKGLPSGTYYRNYLGNAVIKDLGTAKTDHRNVDLATAINPSTVTITVKESTSVLNIGTLFVDYVEFDFAGWLNYISPTGGNNIGASGVKGLIVVTGIDAVKTLQPTDKVFMSGTIIVLDSAMNVKLIIDRWANKWTPETGWVKQGPAGDWSYGTSILASYLTDIVTEGDIMILASQENPGMPTGVQYRDVVGNQLLFDLGNTIITGDHRTVTDLTTAINPTTVTIQFIELD